MKRVGIHQPNYAPWLGYFAKLGAVDDFVFLEDCQMPIGRSYVSRVQIRGRDGAEWMTVPVQRVRGESINAVRFAERGWSRKHVAKLQWNYGRTPFFDPVMQVIRPMYEDPGELLAPFNRRIIIALAGYMGLSLQYHLASAVQADTTGTDRLIDLVRAVGGTVYVSGAGGTKYQDPHAFRADGIELDIRSYQPVPYVQVHGGFMPGLSVLDALFNIGPDASRLLQYPSLTDVPTVAL